MKILFSMFNFFQSQKFCLGLNLAFTIVYAILGLQKAFQAEYVVQDDARQHVFWMQKIIDRELFPNDLIADYFQNVAPQGYVLLYKLGAFFQIDPMLFNKFLPLFIGIITTIFCFQVSQKIFSVPLCAFISTLLLNQSLWKQDDLISATPRAFIYPLLLAFIYYFLQRSLFPCLLIIVLQGLFYPHTILLSSGLVCFQLLSWQKEKIKFISDKQTYIFCLSCLMVAAIALLSYGLSKNQFAPVITAAEAKLLPEFWPGGRSSFFKDNPWEFWLFGARSGIFPDLFPPLILSGLFLPLLYKHSHNFPLLKHDKNSQILLQLTLVSIGLFFLAHLVLFRLHLPNRYIEHSMKIVAALASGIFLTTVIDKLRKIPRRKLLSLSLVFLISANLLVSPHYFKHFPQPLYVVGNFPQLYKFFQQQPKDIVIASLVEEANNIPSFAQRSILVGREYAIPYHLGYYLPFRKKTIELIQAQYSQNLSEVKNFIKKYKINFWLLQTDSFLPEYLKNNKWLKQFIPTQKALTDLQKNLTPALAKHISTCTVFSEQNLLAIDSQCLLKMR